MFHRLADRQEERLQNVVLRILPLWVIARRPVVAGADNNQVQTGNADDEALLQPPRPERVSWNAVNRAVTGRFAN